MSRTEWQAALAMPVRPDRDHIRGRSDAPVTLVQYGDYECPHSGAAYSIIKDVQTRMNEGLRFVFRNFPIDSHPSRPTGRGGSGGCGQPGQVLADARPPLREPKTPA
jgi:protein-disulfide isomerase